MRLASSFSFSNVCIEDEDDDEDEVDGATAPFIVPPTRRLKPRWTPPSPAVGEKSSRPRPSILLTDPFHPPILS